MALRATTSQSILISPINESEMNLFPTDDIKCKKLFTYFPMGYWLPRYKIKRNLLDDTIAGLTCGIMVIPQGMGYSLIAGLEPIYGLYGCMFGPLLYAFFGTSGQLAVAPVAIISLMTGEALEMVTGEMEFNSEEEKIKMDVAVASTIAFQVALIQLLIGLFRGGVIANLLSSSVILGFTCAASILIGFTQVKYIFGITIARGEFIAMLVQMFKNLKDTHWQSFVMSSICFIFLLLLRFWKKSKKALWGQKYAAFFPGPLIVIIVCTFYVWLTDNNAGFQIIGEIQNGLPEFSNFFQKLPNTKIFWDLWTTSLMIALIAFVQSYSVADKFAQKRNYHIEASQELIANAAPNLIGCWFQIYPVTGGLSRTAVVDAANGTTPLQSLITGIFMILALSLFVFLFEYLPKCVLGAIIMVSVYNLFDWRGMIRLWRVKKKDFYVCFITFIITLFFGVEFGIAVGVIVSIIMFIQRATMAHYAVLGRLEFDDKQQDSTVYRNIKNYEHAETRDDTLILRWDASLFFGNMFTFKAKVNKQIVRMFGKRIRREKGIEEDECCLILCFSGINDIDATAAEALCHFIKELQKKYDGLTILITNIKKPVKRVLQHTQFEEIVGTRHIFFEVDEAENWWSHYVEEQKDDDIDNNNESNGDVRVVVGIEEQDKEQDVLVSTCSKLIASKET